MSEMFFLNSSLRRVAGNLLLVLIMAAGVVALPASAAAPKQKIYATPEAASAALFKAARTGKHAALNAVLGPDAKRLGSGDAVQAKLERESFVRAYNEKHSLQIEGDTRATLILGNNEWPFSVPLVKQGKGWRFDTAAGEVEIINRRIGQNELYAVQTLKAVLDAQNEYVTVDRDGDGVRVYAQKFRSSAGKQDGLYWPVKAGEARSPLGLLVAAAVLEGYAPKSDKPVPYWGYYYRILTEQGAAAKGGAYSYLAEQKMIGGFAAVAYPAEYGVSGVKTFIINHDGVVFENDLGANTGEMAVSMKQFNPDTGWEKMPPSLLSQPQ